MAHGDMTQRARTHACYPMVHCACREPRMDALQRALRRVGRATPPVEGGGVSQTRRWLYSWLESALTRAGRVSCRVRGCARPIPRGPMPLVACISWLVLPSNAAERARNDALQSMLRHVVTDTCSFYSTLHDACNSRVRCGSFLCVCARSMTHVRAWGVCRHFFHLHGAW